MSDVIVIDVVETPIDISVPDGVPVCIDIGVPGPVGPPGPPGPPGGPGAGFVFWPRTLDTVVTIPDDHTMPTRDLLIADGGEIIIGDGSELLVL